MLDATLAPDRAATSRRATDADIPLLTDAELLVSMMPDGHSMWDEVALGGRKKGEVVSALFALRAWHWANVEDFTILEVRGEPAALGAVFDARYGEPRIAVDLARTGDLAERLGWDAAAADGFARSYRALWGADLSYLVPQAPAIVETVAVLPAFRGLRLGDRLMAALKADAAARGFEALGVMVVAGNAAAERLYRRHFDPFITYHAAYFGGVFPGIVKFRAALP
jgi:ribosomal protein S18 acetylase RimI-like enzyme